MLDLGLLLAQLVVILVTARVAGRLVRPLGQPQVIGEMIAGLALGPSVLGAIAPGAFAALFPPAHIEPLAVLSQLGVVLFMFVVGLRLDVGLLRSRVRTAVAVSQASIAFPFVLGSALALLFSTRLAPVGQGILPFALFLGASMSVTAFPVLARIIAERGLLGTHVGAVATAAAAVADVTAWCILAAVVAVARASQGSVDSAAVVTAFTVTLVGTSVYALGLAMVGRLLLRRIAARRTARQIVVTPQFVSIAVLLALASAWVTEFLGVHALFGAFLAGAVVPRATEDDARHGRAGLAESIAERIDDVVSAVLLPVFFAFTGLRTSVALVSGGAMWTIFALILVVAVIGKLGGSAAAARLTGMRWREALSVGVLMNTRGLMELVILGVGLDIGVITPTLYAMMVLVALCTTVMASPLLVLLQRPVRARSAASSPAA